MKLFNLFKKEMDTTHDHLSHLLKENSDLFMENQILQKQKAYLLSGITKYLPGDLYSKDFLGEYFDDMAAMGYPKDCIDVNVYDQYNILKDK